MQPSVYCFDLDGTLVNTAELNRQAYLTLGVEIPERAWGLPWIQWLPHLYGGDVDTAAMIHRAKTSIYLGALMRADFTDIELPAARLALEVYRHNPDDVKILTASSPASAKRIISRLQLDNAVSYCGITYAQRMRFLDEVVAKAPTTYVDDNEKTIDLLRVDTPNVKLVHYVGQDIIKLRSQMELA